MQKIQKNNIIQALMIMLFCFCSNILLAQNIPIAEMQKHLINSGEISNIDDTSEIFYSRIISNNKSALFRFGSKSNHSYFFLLVKNANKCKILNCHDLNTDWDDLRQVFIELGDSLKIEEMIAVIDLYKLNNCIHKSPNMPVFKKGKFTGETSVSKRIIVPTTSFICEF